jgi:hypothetical protein
MKSPTFGQNDATRIFSSCNQCLCDFRLTRGRNRSMYGDLKVAPRTYLQIGRPQIGDKAAARSRLRQKKRSCFMRWGVGMCGDATRSTRGKYFATARSRTADARTPAIQPRGRLVRLLKVSFMDKDVEVTAKTASLKTQRLSMRVSVFRDSSSSLDVTDSS